MNPASVIAASILAIAAPALAQAGEGPEAAEAQQSARRFGPFEALTFDARVIRDARYDESGNVYLQLQPDHKNKEIRVKLSNDYFASYRPWLDGSLELVSPAGQGKPDYGWTDHVNTSARYIEYWMDGEVFLHLKRADL